MSSIFNFVKSDCGCVNFRLCDKCRKCFSCNICKCVYDLKSFSVMYIMNNCNCFISDKDNICKICNGCKECESKLSCNCKKNQKM